MEEVKNPFLEKSLEVIEQIYGKNAKIGHTYIFIPPTYLLDEIYAQLGVKSFEEMFPSMIDFENYFSIINHSDVPKKEFVLKIFKEDEGLNVLSEETLSRDNGELLTVFYIEGLVLNDEIANEIERRTVMIGAKGNEYMKMPKDVFRNIILAGGLKGKDLVGLCVTNPVISEKCDADNYFIFRTLLEKDFGLKKYKRNPRELYLLMYKIGEFLTRFHREYIEVIYKESGKKDFLDNYDDWHFFLEDTPWQLLYSLTGYGDLHIEGFLASKLRNKFQMHNLDMIFDKLLFHVTKNNDDSRIDMEDVWFEKIRPEKESKISEKELNEIDDFWDRASAILKQNLKGVNIRTTIKKSYEEAIDGVLVDYLNYRGYTLYEPKQFKLSEDDLDCLVAMHELVMDGTISVTYPLHKWEFST